MTSKGKSGRDEASNSARRVVASTIGDTTWRMFAPTLIGILGGHYLDEAWGTTPCILLGGIVFGAAGAGLLIWRQFKQDI